MQTFRVAGNFLLGSLFTLLLVSEFSFKENSVKAINKSNQWNAPSLPEAISFADEKVPVDRWDVKEKFDKEFLQIYYGPGSNSVPGKTGKQKFSNHFRTAEGQWGS